MLPLLLTLPEKVSNWPGANGRVGHALVTTMPGVRVFEQVVMAELVISGAQFVNESLPVAVNVAVLGLEELNGTQLPLNDWTWLVARVGKNATRNCPPLTKFVTDTLNSVLLPQLVTVPV